MENKQSKHSYNAKFGSSTANNGFTQVPNLLLDNMVKLKLKHSEMMVLMMLLRSWYRVDRFPIPSVDTLAASVGLSKRQTQRVLASLETKPVYLDDWAGEDGYIRKIVRRQSVHGDVNQLSNGYDLTPLVNVVKHLSFSWEELLSGVLVHGSAAPPS